MYVPTTYHSPADATELGTIWLGYIPSDLVDTLAIEIKAKQSAFYTSVPDGVAKALASHVNSGFAINSVPDPNVNSSGGSGATGATGDSGRTRQDAIIGVVSALGGIALLVLIVLVWRSVKRRRELAHRRLSDPDVSGMAGAAGERPEGREFDRDSVGGARRRSFYYAEDSLRLGGQAQGAQAQGGAYAGQGYGGDEWGYQNQNHGGNVMGTGVGVQGMSQRRNVMPATISAPILQESSMNW